MLILLIFRPFGLFEEYEFNLSFRNELLAGLPAGRLVLTPPIELN